MVGDEDNIYRKIITSEEDLKKSAREEDLRYHRKPPYQNRIIKWIDNFYTPFRLGKFKKDGE